MITKTSNSLYQQILEVSEEGTDLPLQDAALDAVRREALERFRVSGFPTTRHEDWKYCNLQPLLSRTYQLEDDSFIDARELEDADLGNVESLKIFFVNGKFRPDLSSSVDAFQNAGIQVSSFEDVLDNAVFKRYFAKTADRTDNPMVSVNTAAFQSGLFIHLPDGAKLSKMLQIIHLASNHNPLFSQERLLLVFGDNTEAEIAQHYISAEQSVHSFNNQVSEIYLGRQARVQHYVLQTAREQGNYVNHFEISQEKHSVYNNYNCTFPGAAFVRNNINVRLNDEAVESHLYGITLTAGKQFVDNHTIVDHKMPHCESYEWYKNMAQDKSVAVFNGKIFVRLDAQKTNAFQQNNNMLIGDESTVYAKPQLEIFADDVKCSHGCTVGQFDDEALFYLRARGVGVETARILLVHAFAFDVTEKIENKIIRAFVEARIEKGLGL